MNNWQKEQGTWVNLEEINWFFYNFNKNVIIRRSSNQRKMILFGPSIKRRKKNITSLPTHICFCECFLCSIAWNFVLKLSAFCSGSISPNYKKKLKNPEMLKNVICEKVLNWLEGWNCWNCDCSKKYRRLEIIFVTEIIVQLFETADG